MIPVPAPADRPALRPADVETTAVFHLLQSPHFTDGETAHVWNILSFLASMGLGVMSMYISPHNPSLLPRPTPGLQE